MKQTALTFLALCAFSGLAFAGTSTASGKEMQQTAVQQTCDWYSDTEFTIGVWGAYAFGGDDNNDNFGFNNNNNNDNNSNSSFIRDSAAGGGVDAKFFFHRSFGIGIEGFGLGNLSTGDRGRRDRLRASGNIDNETDGAGAALATFTFRFPLNCSRWSPYAFVGAGGIFGSEDNFVRRFNRFVREDGDQAQFLGQAGVGVEYRFGRHLGLMGDISGNFSEDNSFGMVRAGVNFAF